MATMRTWIGYAGVAVASAAATLAVGGVALAAGGAPGSLGAGWGRFAAVDPDGDGKVTRAEWLAAANARFAALDANRDGSLAVGELPPPGRHGRGGRGRHRHGWHDGPAPEGPEQDGVGPQVTPSAPATPR
jgi:hypothetical protein